jgi:hypothetical protein
MAAAGDDRALERRIVEQVNRARKQAGSSPLRTEPRLARAARRHSSDMARRGQLAHELNGRGAADRVSAVSYEYAMVGENLAFNQQDAEEVVRGWMKSPGHRANILEGRFTETGVAVARDERGRRYFTQVFALPLAAMGQVATSAQFSLRNDTGVAVLVALPGEQPPARMKPDTRSRFTVTFIGRPPTVQLSAGSVKLELRPADGAAYALRLDAEGRLVAEAVQR